MAYQKPFSIFMKTTGDDAAKAIEELRKNVTSRLNLLKSRIGEMEVKLAKGGSGKEEQEREEVDIDKLVTEKIEQLNLPAMIQRELEDLKEDDSKEIDVERLISERVNKINFSLMIQSELNKADSSGEGNAESTELKSKYRTIESDITTLKTKTDSTNFKLEGLSSQIRGFALQLKTIKTTDAIPLMSRVIHPCA